MAYDKAKFEKLISLEVPYKIALALSDNDSPLISAGEPVADLAGGATTAQAVTKINELLASLRDAGILDV